MPCQSVQFQNMVATLVKIFQEWDHLDNMFPKSKDQEVQRLEQQYMLAGKLVNLSHQDLGLKALLMGLQQPQDLR